ncbi:MAG: (d)CMP kinase [Flavobacterium sp.]
MELETLKENPITIAIDGHSSTGKSTLAKQLAKTLGYVYVDTGAMYRAVTLYAMRKGWVCEETIDIPNLVKGLKEIILTFKFNEELGFGEMFLNGENVEQEIRQLEVSKLVSKVAEVSEVRTKLVEQQQLMGNNKGVVMDGRDIGTVVFPDAEMKLFMTASSQTRAKRRYDELLKKGQRVTFDEVLKNVEERDYIDSNRADSPLVQAEGAIVLDNSGMTKEEQYQVVLKWLTEI